MDDSKVSKGFSPLTGYMPVTTHSRVGHIILSRFLCLLTTAFLLACAQVHVHSHTFTVAPATVNRHILLSSAPRTFSGPYCVHWTRADFPSCLYTDTRRAESFTRNRTCNRPHSPPLCTAAVGCVCFLLPLPCRYSTTHLTHFGPGSSP